MSSTGLVDLARLETGLDEVGDVPRVVRRYDPDENGHFGVVSKGQTESQRKRQGKDVNPEDRLGFPEELAQPRDDELAKRMVCGHE